MDDFSRIREDARRFRQTLAQTKRMLGAVDFEWYPSDTLSAFNHFDGLLAGAYRSLLAGRKRILDVGCQDGEIAFYLESLGHEVTALDHPMYNHNCMKGVRALHRALGSRIGLLEVDLDRQFALPAAGFDIAIVLGVLYHLRNPFYVLEELARRASQCILSTRIARRFPDGAVMPAGVPVAYLLRERELNDDETNYFIFSECGLRTLLARTSWDLRGWMTTGGALASDPIRPERDERAFCLLESVYGRLPEVEFLAGWHQPEGSGWRWTKQEFTARVRSTGARPPRTLALDLYISDDLIERNRSVALSVRVNGQALPPEVYASSGPKKLARRLKRITSMELLLEFSLNAALPPDSRDPRERGVVVSAIAVE